MDFIEELANAQTLWESGQLEAAWQATENLNQIAPQNPQLLHLRGILLSYTPSWEMGVRLLKQAAQLGPLDWPELYLSLGIVLEAKNQLKEAENWLLKTLNSPQSAKGHYALGKIYARMGRAKKAHHHYEKAAELNPKPDIEKTSLFHLLSTPGISNSTRRQHFEAYAEKHLNALRQNYQYLNSPDPERPLKIGFISADFHQHVAANNFISLFQYRDRSQMKFYAYAHLQKVDDWTRIFQAEADQWLEIQTLTDEKIAERIYQDQIDILIDCSGYSKGKHLKALARKPAPIQISAFGFLHTTGLEAIDYQFTDPYAIPEHCSDWYSEDLIYLTTQLHWTPWRDPDQTLAPTASPFLTNGYITFGCGNAPHKLNQEVLELCAQVLNQVPNSRLILKYFGFEVPDIQSHFRETFARHHISPSRIEFQGKTSALEHMAFYQNLDIALDPFPYPGGMSTCETLYMGVPILALREDCLPVSIGLLHQVKAPDLISDSKTDFIQNAILLTQDDTRLKNYHQTLRQRLLDSPICDGQRFTSEIETACRQIWRFWCQSQKA